MDRKRIAKTFQEMSLLLELSGANPFKSRAFANGAHALEALDEDLEVLVNEERLEEVDGIGKTIARGITELVRTGRFEDYEELKKSVPEGLLEIRRIPGLGSKKVRTLWKDMGITNLDELEAAATAGELRDRKGFGKKSEQNILEGIARRRKRSGRFLWPQARAVADAFEARLAEHPRVLRVSVAGSLRRRLETVHDVDLLAAVAEEHRTDVMEAFVESPEVDLVIVRGSTKSSIVTSDGVQVDLRAVGDHEFPFALHHFTGSREHNTALRGRAKGLGLKMSEWGVFRGEESLEASDEEGVFGLLGLPWIPPELRENGGEIEAAESGTLPDLLDMRDVRGALHVHTTASDGVDGLREMVDAVRARGWNWIGIADHSQSAIHANGLTPEGIREQAGEIEELRARTKGIRIFHGIESDVLEDGSLDYDDDVLAGLDFVIASVHAHFSRDPRVMTDRILTAIRHPAVSVLGHPTGRLLLERDGYPLDLEEVLAEAGKLGVAVELNAGPRRLDLDWRWHRRAVASGVTISIGPDAHDTDGLDRLEYGIGVARKGWLGPGDVLNCRPARAVEKFFRARRAGWKPEAGRRARYDEKGALLG